MTTSLIESPPAITAEAIASIVRRHGEHTDCSAEPYWVARGDAHYRLMAPMGNDRRVQYLGTAGCDDETVRLITQAVAESVGKAAKPALHSAARECIAAKKDIDSLLDKWPEPKHRRLLSEKIEGLSDEQIGLAYAYAACQIYETAATALYLAIVDGMSQVVTEGPVDLDIMTRDRAIADAGYTDGWLKFGIPSYGSIHRLQGNCAAGGRGGVTRQHRLTVDRRCSNG